jgi:hypothetical protein
VDAIVRLEEQQLAAVVAVSPTATSSTWPCWSGDSGVCLNAGYRRQLRLGRCVTGPAGPTVPEQWFVLVTCRDEKQQVELLGRLSGEGLECRALLS